MVSKIMFIRIKMVYQSFKSDYDKLTYYLNQVNYYMIQPLYKLLNLSDFNYIDLETKYKLLYNSISYPILISTIKNIIIESYKKHMQTHNDIVTENKKGKEPETVTDNNNEKEKENEPEQNKEN